MLDFFIRKIQEPIREKLSLFSAYIYIYIYIYTCNSSYYVPQISQSLVRLKLVAAHRTVCTVHFSEFAKLE